MNRIELYDEHHRLLDISGSTSIGTNSNNSNVGHLDAYPHSVNSCLPENEPAIRQAAENGLVYPVNDMVIRDGRVPANLVGPHSTADSCCWLAPLRSSLDHNDMTPNVIYVTFDRPTTLSCVKLFNYTKTPSRGVSGFDLSIDDAHVYSGTLLAGNIKKEQVVLFTNEANVVQEHSSRINYCGRTEQSVLMIDERQVKSGVLNKQVQRGVGAYHGDVAVDLNQRPQTAAHPML